MFSRMFELLAVKITPFEMLCVITVVVSLLFLSDTIKAPVYVPYTVDPYPTKEERLHAVSKKDRIRWCEVRRDCKVLAEAVVYEARSEDKEGQAAVAHVILNRAEDSRWGDTIPEVVYQRKQFSYTNKGQEQRNVPSRKDWEIAMDLCFFILNGVVESPVGEATFYHTKKVNPSWAKKVDYVATIGQHIFYQ